MFKLLAIAALVLIAASAASAIEFRILESGTRSTSGTVTGRLLMQLSAGSTWRSVAYNSGSESTYTARSMCEYLGWSSPSSTASMTSTSISSTYPNYFYGLSCSYVSTATTSNFGSYCTYSTTGSASYSTSITCSGTRNGGSIGVYAGGYYIRNYYSSKLEWRYDHTSSWYSICPASSYSSYSSYPDSTTGKALCGMMSQNFRYFSRTSKTYTAYMRSLDCSYSSATTLDSCSKTISSTCGTSIYALVMYCTTSSSYTPSSSTASSGELGVIIGASVGGFIGLIIFIVIISVCCAACRSGTGATTMVVSAKTMSASQPAQPANNWENTSNTNNSSWNNQPQQPPPQQQQWGQAPQQPPPQQWGQAPPPQQWGPPPQQDFNSTGNFNNNQSWGAPPPGYGQPPAPGGYDPNMAAGVPPPSFGVANFGPPPPQ